MPPVLFVHGLWHGAWCWDEHFVPWFKARGYDAQALTLRRHDERHAPGLRTTRVREYVEDVERAAAKMGSPPVVIGHSMGGFVTQLYLSKHVAPAAVLVASIPPNGIMPATLKVAARHPLRLLASNVTMSLYGFVKTPDRAREMFFGPELSEDEVRRYQSRLTDDSYFVYLDLLFFSRPVREAVRRTPVLVLGGEKDTAITRGQVESTAKAYGAEVAMFPGAHDLMLDTGWERVAERIDSFIRSRTAVTV